MMIAGQCPSIVVVAMAQATFSCPCGAIHLESAQLRFPRRHKLRIPRSGHAGQTSLTSLLRLSPPRRRGGDPNAKTAPAPLHPKGTSAPTPWAWALLLSPPRGARRGPHIWSCQKRNGPYPQGVCRSRKRQSRQRLRDCTAKKKRTLLAATLHICAKLLYGGRRIGASADLGSPSGTLGPSARPILPSRGGWCGGHRGGCRMDFLLFPLPLAGRSGTARSPGASRFGPAGQFLIPNSYLNSPHYLLSLPLPVLSCRRAGGGLFTERSFP